MATPPVDGVEAVEGVEELDATGPEDCACASCEANDVDDVLLPSVEPALPAAVAEGGSKAVWRAAISDWI